MVKNCVDFLYIDASVFHHPLFTAYLQCFGTFFHRFFIGFSQRFFTRFLTTFFTRFFTTFFTRFFTTFFTRFFTTFFTRFFTTFFTRPQNASPPLSSSHATSGPRFGCQVLFGHLGKESDVTSRFPVQESLKNQQYSTVLASFVI